MIVAPSRQNTATLRRVRGHPGRLHGPGVGEGELHVGKRAGIAGADGAAQQLAVRQAQVAHEPVQCYFIFRSKCNIMCRIPPVYFP